MKALGITLAALALGVIALAIVVPRLASPPAAPTPGALRALRVPFPHVDIGFRYPDEWTVLAEGVSFHRYESIGVVLGIGQWDRECRPAGFGAITCPDEVILPAGGVVVTLATRQGPPGACESAPPPDAKWLPSGLPATVREEQEASQWRVYVPEWICPLVVSATYERPNVEERRAQVQALVESLTILPR